jgi:hypothetical protein
MQSRFFDCVAHAGSSAARGSCRQNGGRSLWLESAGQATIQVFWQWPRRRRGAMKAWYEASGIKCVAVASHRFNAEQRCEAGADNVIGSLEEALRL